MSLIHSEYKDRIAHWVRTLKKDFYAPLGEVKFSFFPAFERMSLTEVQKQEFFSIEPGFLWGASYEYGWFRSEIILPQTAEGKRIVLDLHPGGESTLFVNGQAFGTYRAGWIREPHHFLVDNTIALKGKPGSRYDLYMETYAGHYIPEAESGDCAVGPVLPGCYKDPLEEGSRRCLGTSTYGIWDEDAYQLYMDIMTLGRLLQVLDLDSLRAQKVAQALERFTLCVEFEQEKEERSRSYREAREILRPVLRAENGSTMPVFSCVGNSHLDLVWLWTKEETRRKTARTFAAQLRLLEEYEDYYFIQSQPACYEMCREYYPELFEKIRQAVKEGRWIAEGAMWVEPDTNMAGGEALIRQLLYGKKYYKEMFQVDSRLLWLPDTFGYSAALPQILKGCEVDYLVTQKIFWSYNEGESFPYHYFNWKGMDGSQVVSFLPTSYTYETDPGELNQVWKKRAQKRELDCFLIPFGYGDGGGGPTRDHIEYLKRQKNLEGSVRVQMESPLEFFKKMDKKGGPYYTYTGELYFNAHRGTYTSQAEIKKLNRRGEFSLRALELWASTAACLKGLSYPTETIEKLWKILLFNQFHDILPGSSIQKVYEDAERELSYVCKEAKALTAQVVGALTAPGKGITLFNSLPFERTCFVELEGKYGRVTIPSLGMKTLKPEDSCFDEPFVPACVYEEAGFFIMENEILHLKIDEKGEIVSLKLKKNHREFASSPMNHFRIFKDVPRKFDAWDIDSNYEEQEIPGARNIRVKILSSGGIKASLEVSFEIGNSYIKQEIHLESGSARVEFRTQADWRELHRLLKVSFPTVLDVETGRNEVQFGYIERPMHRSRAYEKDRFEVCCHRYSAVCDGGNGFGILNDSKYGISMKEGTLELTLLRAGACPEMRADNRVHTFTYGITIWEGDFHNSRIVCQGYEINEPPLILSGTGEPFSLASVDKGHIMIDAVKLAEDGSGDLILRIYEAEKWRDQAVLTIGIPVEGAWECNMLEHKKQELNVNDRKISLDFHGFEVKTLRIARKRSD